MLTYIEVEVENNKYRGGIVITSTGLAQSLNGADKIIVSRKLGGTNTWIEMQTIELETVADLTFELFDILAKPNESYYYAFDVKSGNTVIESGVTEDVECELFGMFVGDMNEQYVAGTNFSVDTVRNTQVTFVTTLANRTPFRVSNANTNYTSGSAKGLFLELTVDKKRFVPDYDREFSENVLNFLTNGQNKILKMPDGRMWYIAIDGNPSSPHNDNYDGMNGIEFKWVEIGDLPTTGMVID